MSRHRWLVAAVFSSLLLASSCAAEERAAKARAVKVGTTTASLISKAGPPTIERLVIRGTPPGDPCVDDQQSVRAFEYHVPYWTAPIMKLPHRPTVAAKTVVCLDADGRVRSAYGFKY